MRLTVHSPIRTPASPTTALRQPKNYGLRGWISTRSNELAAVLEGVSHMAACQGGSCSVFSHPAECFGDLSREHERHEDVERPDWPAVAGMCGGRRGTRGRRGRVCRIR